MIVWALFSCTQLATGDVTCELQRGMPYMETEQQCLELKRQVLELLIENDRRTHNQTTGLWFECRWRHVDPWEEPQR